VEAPAALAVGGGTREAEASGATVLEDTSEPNDRVKRQVLPLRASGNNHKLLLEVETRVGGRNAFGDESAGSLLQLEILCVLKSRDYIFPNVLQSTSLWPTDNGQATHLAQLSAPVSSYHGGNSRSTAETPSTRSEGKEC
jgi:hypothetical protein